MLARSKRLHKKLGPPAVYAIATGTTLSAGFFLLPGVALPAGDEPRRPAAAGLPAPRPHLRLFGIAQPEMVVVRSRPAGALVALVRRRGETLVPRGATVLEAGDRLTILGDPGGLRELRRRLTGEEAA